MRKFTEKNMKMLLRLQLKKKSQSRHFGMKQPFDQWLVLNLNHSQKVDVSKRNCMKIGLHQYYKVIYMLKLGSTELV